MQGEKERQCLDVVKSLLNCSCYYGMSEDDCTQFKTIIKTAKDNPEPSKFPDFIFDHGFIEHFIITSSKSNRNGYLHKREYNAFLSDMENKMQTLQDELNKTVQLGELKLVSGSFKYPEHSYENLQKSFKTTWEKHISNMEKSRCCKEVGIFLIDYSEMVLKRYIDFGVQSALYYGDMLFKEKNPWYMLSRDKKLLSYIYKYKDEIKYVIFKTFNCVEVINTANIFEILKLIPWNYKVYPCSNVVEKNVISGISVPKSFTEGGEADDNT